MTYVLEAIDIPKVRPVYEKIELLLETQKRRDPYYEGHARRACLYAIEFGRHLRLSEMKLRQLYLGTFFHDIGKILIPAEIINKNGALDRDEREIMRMHPTLGENICRQLGPFEEIAPLVACHHERPNGTGYPNGLKGNEIPELDLILAIIEIYDALRSERSYKKPFSLEQSLDILYQDAATGNLDAQLVRDFAKFVKGKSGQLPYTRL